MQVPEEAMPGICGFVKAGVAMIECSPGGQLHSHGCYTLVHPSYDASHQQLQQALSRSYVVSK